MPFILNEIFCKIFFSATPLKFKHDIKYLLGSIENRRVRKYEFLKL